MQLPQFAVLVFVSTQADPHSICPATEQPQAPALQTAPGAQAIPQPPQLSGSFPFVVTHDPLPHIVVPPVQLEAQLPALQTWVPEQACPQEPQFAMSCEMQLPLQLSSPAWHWQDPFWQVCPALQALPHAPQFCGSDAAFTHWVPHAVCPAAHIGPVPPVPVGLPPLTFPSQPSIGTASSAIASAAKIERFEVFIATTFRTEQSRPARAQAVH